MPESISPAGYTEEMSPGPPKITGAPTSIAAFVGKFKSGPTNQPVEVTGVDDLTNKFGDPYFESARVVSQFLANGGRTAFVVRVNDVNSVTEKSAAIEDGIQALDQINRFNLLCIPAASEIEPSAFVASISHAEQVCQQRRAFLLIDSPSSLNKPEDVLDWLKANSQLRQANAALYFPWVIVSDGSSSPRRIPPTGGVAGVIAQMDENHGVWKAPSGNEATLTDILALDYSVSAQESDVLNRQGENTLRHFPGLGPVCWGARTLSPDPEWRYVSARRLALLLEDSIDHGLQWTVFESNNERLWANVRRAIEDFLFDLWKAGALMGVKPEQAFFVKCDRTTMTQSDLDNGRLICLVGFAPLKPAEFVILRIARRTAES